MASIIWGKREELPESSFKALLHYRYRVFIERLGWQLTTHGSEETDQFDGPGTVYGIAFDEHGAVKGCARLLPTTKPYLLAEVFPALLHGEPAPRSERIWEVSRFATTDLETARSDRLQQFSGAVTRELVNSTLEYAATLGAEQLVGVSPAGLERLLRKMGVEVRTKPAKPTAGSVIACWIDVARGLGGMRSAVSRKGRSSDVTRTLEVKLRKEIEGTGEKAEARRANRGTHR